MVDRSDIVDEVPKGRCIPDIRKAYKSIKARWHPNKSASSSPTRIEAEEKCTRRNEIKKKHPSSSSNCQVHADRPSTSKTDQEFEQDYSVIHQEEEDNMNGIHNFRYSHSNRMHDDELKSPRGWLGNRSPFFTSMPSSLSRSASKRSQTPTPSASFRSMSRRSVEMMNYPPASSLSRSSSRMSSTPIMFSNSNGMVKPPAIEKALECTLEELCYGCMKKIKVTRDVLTNIGQIIQEEELLTIKVKPGWKKGTKITFQGMGNERPGVQPADITFVIAEKRHTLFRRDGNDLELVVEIPLVKALTGCSLTVPLLGGEELSLTIEDIICPGYVKILIGQGMPISKDQGKRGNLKVIFLINFPTDLTDEQRQEAVSILEEEYKEEQST